MNKKLNKFFAILAAVFLISACNVAVEPAKNNKMQNNSPNDAVFTRNVATAPFEFKEIPSVKRSGEELSVKLTPEEFSSILESEGSTIETLNAVLPAYIKPKQADVLFVFDLTGSMGGSVNQARANAQNIMQNLRNLIPDTEFGLISHKDYPTPPFGSDSDYPYKLHAPITDNTTLIQEEMGRFQVSGGGNGPESYSRVFYEAYSDSKVGWRSGAKRFLIIWLDNVPHAKDPGRDGKINTNDDLMIDDVLKGLKENNITLLTLCSGGSQLSTWQAYAQVTDGGAYAIDTGTDIAALIADKVAEKSMEINKLSLKVAEPKFAHWLTSVTPAQYTGIILDTAKSFDFSPTFTVPADTPDGEYVFNLNLVGDGSVYASHKVTIKVVNNRPPLANAGEDISVEQLSPEGSTVTLSGAASSDPENDELTYRWSWTENGENRFADGVEMTAVFPSGTTEVTLTVTEKVFGKSASDTVLVTVQDTTPPQIISVERSQYWWVWDIFDNRYIYVCKVLANDTAATPKISVSTVQVFRNGETQEGKCYIKENGEVYVQLPKDGKSRARNFHVTITVTDNAGNSITREEVFRRF